MKIKINKKTLSFPLRELIEIIGSYKTETIIFDITGKESLCGLHGMDDNCLDILMPMKVNEGDFE